MVQINVAFWIRQHTDQWFREHVGEEVVIWRSWTLQASDDVCDAEYGTYCWHRTLLNLVVEDGMVSGEFGGRIACICCEICRKLSVALHLEMTVCMHPNLSIMRASYSVCSIANFYLGFC